MQAASARAWDMEATDENCLRCVETSTVLKTSVSLRPPATKTLPSASWAEQAEALGAVISAN